MNRKKVAGIVLAGAFLLAAALLANLVFTGAPTSRTVRATSTEPSPYKNIQITKKEATEKKWHISLEYPAFQQPEVNEKLDRYVSRKQSDFLKEVKQAESGKLTRQPASLSLTFQLVPAGEKAYFIVFTEKTYMADEKMRISMETFAVHPEEHAIAGTAALFINPEKAAGALQLPDLQQANVLIKEQEAVFWTERKRNNAVRPVRKVMPFLKKEWRGRFGFPEKSSSEEHASPKIALTFDDGPNPESTERILAILEKHNVPATFFMVGSQVNRYPALANKVVQAGHEVGNHSWSHRDFTKLKAAQIKKEIDRTSAAVEQAAGVTPIAVRPPYGAVNGAVETAMGTTPVLWTVDTMDWKSRDPKAIYAVVEKEAKNGSIVLMHDIHETTAEAMDKMISFLEKKGYRFVTVSEM